MGIFDVVTNAVVNLVGVVAQGAADILQAIAKMDVGTIVIVLLILFVGKVAYDKYNAKK